jgi:CRISPR-associated endoribonuclease Cas6/Csy4 subtype I-F
MHPRYQRYAEIRLLARQDSEILPGGAPFALGRIIKAVHLINDRLSPQYRIGLGFPVLGIEGQSTSGGFPGRVVRAFARSSDDLEFLMGHPLIAGMASLEDALEVTPVSRIPETSRFTCYIRDRSIEKSSEAWAHRSFRSETRNLERRMAASKSVPARTIMSVEERLKRSPAPSLAVVASQMIHVNILSRSTEQAFKLNIRAVPVDGPGEGDPANYGLSVSPWRKPVDDGRNWVAVPNF